jgi:PKD repeat protein
MNGNYYAILRMTSPNCTASIGGTVLVTNTATPCNLAAGFFYNGSFNNFTSGANGSTTYSWNFGDNTTGTGFSPVHTYSASGNYTVTLVANNNTSPACTSTVTNVINVTACNVNPINPSFVYSIGSGGLVTFTSTSTNTTTNTNYLWNFGGLGVFSGTNLAQTSFTFPSNGNFMVTLQVINSAPSCTASTTQTVGITNASPCALIAAFSYSQIMSGVVQFFNSSTGTNGGTSYSWNFGNGNTSNSVNALQTYSANGTYVVSLFANNNTSTSCTSSSAQTITINSFSTCNLSNAFTTSQGGNGLVNFFGSTAGTNSTTTYFWNFGNASTSTLSSPVHTFSANGIYTVTFITNNNSTPSCSITVTQVISVCSVNPPTAGFNYSVNPNGNVVFTSNSTNTTPSTIYYWNLNSSGTYSSASASYTSGVNLTQVSQTYTSGSYGAYLYVTNISPGCTVSSTGSYQTFTVLPPCNLTASYSFTQGLSGLVNFNSTSTGTSTGTVFNWNFGDNTTGAGSVVSHSYAANGTYIATLSVNAPGFSSPCIGTATQTIVINNICVANAGFSLAPTATAQVWNVNLTSPTNVTAAIWSWGDGTTTNALFTSHSYSAAGNYFICLSVTVSCGSSASSCNTYAIYRGTGNNQNDGIIQVDVVDPSNPTAIPSLNKTSTESEVIISPNPNQGSFMINFIEPKSDHSDIRIFDVTGKLIVEQSIMLNSANAAKEINLKDVPNGLYFLQTKCGDQTVNKKILIEK